MAQKKEDNVYRIAKLMKNNTANYKIKNVNEYNYDKFKSKRSAYKILGTIDLFHVNENIEQLIDTITTDLLQNVKLQISLENSVNDRVNQTKLLSKTDMISRLSEWVTLFLDYYDMEPEDITFKLLFVEVPTGAGRVTKIITVDSKRSTIQIKNKHSICLARAIIVSLATNNREKLQNIFKEKLNSDELKGINKTRQTKITSE